jgi:molybdate-binding protein
MTINVSEAFCFYCEFNSIYNGKYDLLIAPNILDYHNFRDLDKILSALNEYVE